MLGTVLDIHSVNLFVRLPHMANPVGGPVRLFGIHRKFIGSLAIIFSTIVFGVGGCGGGSTSVSDSGTGTRVTISTQPASQTVAAGQSATFSVVATGTAPMTYQWRKNGVNIVGRNVELLHDAGCGCADNAAKFIVVVSNSVGSATSNSCDSDGHFGAAG